MGKQLKRVIFTCGGTAGHVNPAIALAQLMHERDPETRFLFVGAERGLEKDLVPKAGYDFRTVHISSFHRSLKPRELRHNVISVVNLMRAPREARAILRQFPPDVVIGTGGYASFPMVKAAAKAGIPTAVHESNMVPGLTTEMLEPFADRIMVGFEACREHYRHPEKVIVTGTPVRRDFFHLTKAEAKRRLGYIPEMPAVYELLTVAEHLEFIRRAWRMEDDGYGEELLERLLASSTPEAYLDEGLTIDRRLPDYLFQLLGEKGMKRSEVVRASGLNSTFVYDVFNGDSRLGRDKAIMLALGMGCTLRETQRLLRLDGVSELWAKNRRDAVIIWCVEHGYSRTQTDDELYRLGEKTLLGTGPLR